MTLIVGLMWLQGALAAAVEPVPDRQHAVGCWPVTGVVVDAATGLSVAGATVEVAGATAAETDRRGRFELCVVGEPPVTLVVRVPGGSGERRFELPARPAGALTLAVDEVRPPEFADEVTVIGQAIRQIEPRREIAPEVVKALPGAGEDVLQTLGALPGVVSVDDWSSRLYVRGGRPDQNGIFLDGIPIHDPYRLFGLTSLFNPDTVGSIDFYPGGFDVRYGDRLSAVIAVENRDGRQDRAIAGAASVALTHTNLVAEGRILESSPSSYLVSARRTYYDLALEQSGDTDSSFPSFLDGQARLAFEPAPGQRFTVTLLGYDEGTDLAEDEEPTFGDVDDRIEALDDQKGFVTGLGGEHRLGGNLRFEYVLAATRNQQSSDIFVREGETGFETAFVQQLTGDVVSLKAQTELDLGRHTVLAGVEAAESSNEVGFTFSTDDPRIEVPPWLRDFTESQDFRRHAAFLQDSWRLTPELGLQAGVRWDRSTLSGADSVSPRASLRWQPQPDLELHGAWGRYTQSASYEALQGDGYFLDLRGIKDLELEPEKAEHRLVGATWTLDRGFKVGVDLYDKQLDDILQSGEYTEDILVLDEADRVVRMSRKRPSYLPENARTGYARGAELTFTILEKPSRPFYGMVAYSWGEARTRDDDGWRPEPWDRSHTLSVFGGWRFSERWELGLRWRYASGFPTTPVTNVLRVVEDVDGDGAYDPAQGDFFTWQRDEPASVEFSDRLPAYHRLDLRLQYSGRPGRVHWTYYLDLINTYARENVIGWLYDEDFSEREPDTGMPFLPSVGVRLTF